MKGLVAETSPLLRVSLPSRIELAIREVPEAAVTSGQPAGNHRRARASADDQTVGLNMKVLLTPRPTGGAISVIIGSHKPGEGPPDHIHFSQEDINDADEPG